MNLGTGRKWFQSWPKVIVDSASREVFAYQEQIVLENRAAAPAP
jgi:hypothetical protein